MTILAAAFVSSVKLNMPDIRNPELGDIVTAYDGKGVLQHGVVVDTMMAGLDPSGLTRWVDALFPYGIDVVYADFHDAWEHKLIPQEHAHGRVLYRQKS